MAKTTTSAMNRVPPFMPILWQDWESDPDTQSMSETQVGIFFKMLLRQWQIGSLPRNAWDLARECKIRSYDTTLKFLGAYSNLIVCCECGASWNREDCECGASKLRGRCENRKLRNLRIDVISGLDLGTTKQNLTKPEPEQKRTASCKPQPEFEPEYDDPAPQGVQASQVGPEQEVHPAPVQVKPAAPASQVAAAPRQEPKPELADIRDWSEDRFGIPGSRLRNCILFQLDYNKNDWYRQNPPTMASMEREKFVTKLDKDTPVGWTPENHNQKKTPEARPEANSDPKKIPDVMRKFMTPEQIRQAEGDTRE